MKSVVQRVREASVICRDQEVTKIDAGAVILLGISRDDTPEDVDYMVRKIAQLRYFDDQEGQLNAAIEAVRGSFLVVSQFTLYGDCRKGNRPGYTMAAPAEQARPLYEEFVEKLVATGPPVSTGLFGEDMVVHIQNDGPVTLILESWVITWPGYCAHTFSFAIRRSSWLMFFSGS